MLGVYIHVPFCKKVCDYCDFKVMPIQHTLFDEYTELLCAEIVAFEQKFPNVLAKAKTLYFGGGTPSTLPMHCLQQIFDCLHNAHVHNICETTMEFNPESTNVNLVNFVRSLGVNRISLGVQSFDSKLLTLVGRLHTNKSSLDALNTLVNCDGLQVSADLMFNLPTQSVARFLEDVDKLSDFNLKHISFYGLNISPKSLLGQHIAKGKLAIDENLYEPMYLGGVKILESKGFFRYEVSNFAKIGFESLHNKNYWERGEYIGFGPSAHSFFGGKRFFAPEMYAKWRTYVQKGSPQNALTVDILNKDSQIMEFLWLSLRQAHGINLNELKKINVSIDMRVVKKWKEKGFLSVETITENKNSVTFIKLIDRGWIFMDDIVTDFANAIIS